MNFSGKKTHIEKGTAIKKRSGAGSAVLLQPDLPAYLPLLLDARSSSQANAQDAAVLQDRARNPRAV
jgi:hypothetical protein